MAHSSHRLIAVAAGIALCLGTTGRAVAQCTGDCGSNGEVTVDELIIGVNIALRITGLSTCGGFDVDSNGAVTVNELIVAVNNALHGCVVAATPTATASLTITPTNSTPAVTTTPTPTTLPAVCGDGVVDFAAGETCDDGNTLDGDACPSTCRIATCAATSGTLGIDVSFAAPAGVDLAALTVFVRYPDGVVRIPGRANEISVQERITNLPDNTFSTPNDLDYALRLVILTPDSSAIPAGRLFTATFDVCADATAPPAAAFPCTVETAANTNNDTVTGTTCMVTLP